MGKGPLSIKAKKEQFSIKREQKSLANSAFARLWCLIRPLFSIKPIRKCHNFLK
jgi:hypothetical protein